MTVVSVCNVVPARWATLRRAGFGRMVTGKLQCYRFSNEKSGTPEVEERSVSRKLQHRGYSKLSHAKDASLLQHCNKRPLDQPRDQLQWLMINFGSSFAMHIFSKTSAVAERSCAYPTWKINAHTFCLFTWLVRLWKNVEIRSSKVNEKNAGCTCTTLLADSDRSRK